MKRLRTLLSLLYIILSCSSSAFGMQDRWEILGPQLQQDIRHYGTKVDTNDNNQVIELFDDLHEPENWYEWNMADMAADRGRSRLFDGKQEEALQWLIYSANRYNPAALSTLKEMMHGFITFEKTPQDIAESIERSFNKINPGKGFRDIRDLYAQHEKIWYDKENFFRQINDAEKRIKSQKPTPIKLFPPQP
ncbi:hypothetical protein [Candidatus Odyssella thessalonicensis]|uniref:hypothetical protein n=1 Tax=Candidatus Odyssella thessalonicensis TaxID=84647 RepID=UPI000225C128|nr:hypothetical protein [Candidatus Odyssella thessalonicensis]